MIHPPHSKWPAALLCASGLVPEGALPWAHAVRPSPRLTALATQACRLEIVSSPHPRAGSCRPHSLPSLGTWSSPAGRRWARAPRGPGPLPRAQPVAPRSPGVPRPWRPHAPSSVPAACRGRCGLCARGPGRPHLPAPRPPAAWPNAGPRRGGGWGGRRDEELETDTASASTVTAGDRRRRRAAAAGGGRLPPPATGGGTPPSAAVALYPQPRGCGPERGLAGECGWPCLPLPRATPQPAGRGSPASRGGAAAAARQTASPWESERGAGSAREAGV